MKAHLLFYILKSLLWLLSLLSIKANHRLGTLLGWIFYTSHSKFRKISDINIRLCFPQLSPLEHDALLKKSLYELGKSMTELGFIWTWPMHKLLDKVSFKGMELAENTIKAGQGVIFLTPHLGCWEIAGIYVSNFLPVVPLYKAPKLKGVDLLLQSVRQNLGGSTIKADKYGVINLLKVLKSGQATCILPDQTPKEISSGTFAPFFGQETLTINLVTKLAIKSKAKILLGYAYRRENGQGYNIELKEVDPELYNPDNLISASALNKEIEQLILQAPEQYLWSYKRFKQAPKGHTKPY